MKKIIVLLTIVLLSCNKDSDTAIASGSIISPSGVVFAKNALELTEKAKIALDREDIRITDIDFMESKTSTSVMVSVETKDEEIRSNFVIARGKIAYNTDNLKVSEHAYRGNMIRGRGDIIIRCEGCQSCKVRGTIAPDGTHNFECESACCTMSVTVEDPQQ